MAMAIPHTPFLFMKRPILFLLLSLALQVNDTMASTLHSPFPRIDLSGVWETNLGPCRLPGTTDESRLGPGNTHTTVTTNLTRRYPYSGVVTYSRTVDIPASCCGADRRLTLVMERTKPSTLYVDGDSIGSCSNLLTPQVYELPSLTPGPHQFVIRIDNSAASVPSGVHGSHAWTDATQTNWNGIIGRFCIEASARSYLREVQIYPDVATRTAQVVARAHQVSPDGKEGNVRLMMPVTLSKKQPTWSEFHPALIHQVVALYADAKGQLTLRVYDDQLPKQGPKGLTLCDVREVTYGLRDFRAVGTQFVINGKKTFLRGKHDGCVFPLTGYPPMDVEGWLAYFGTCKEYGINHVRYHSWTPPEAAFAAADQLGIYLQVELPIWGSLYPGNEPLNSFIHNEALQILSAYGNHPSFVMMGLGNELGGDVAFMRSWLDEFRALDGRHLYCNGSNNDLGWQGPKEGEDFYVTCRVGSPDAYRNNDSPFPTFNSPYESNVRSSFSFADEDDGGLINALRPSTRRDYSAPIGHCPRPVVSHEAGQFQVYPDYKEISQYTGVLYPYNHEVFRERLKANGLDGQVDAFHQATGRWAVDCYKADIEYCLRTPGMGGYQLLDLQDYPGQGTALVGILDAFMHSKGLTTPRAFRQFCAPVVPLALFDDYCFFNTDTLRADLALADYAETDWTEPLRWSLEGIGFEQKGTVRTVAVAQGDVATVGSITLPLAAIRQPMRLTLTLQTGDYANSYPLWVFPKPDSYAFSMLSRLAPVLAIPATTVTVAGITVCSSLAAAEVPLSQGETVLCFPYADEVKDISVGGLFTPDYWNYAMFKTISENNHRSVSPGTLGFLADATHPFFTRFPSEGRTEWSWWSIAKHSTPLILDGLPKEYFPLVQVVDNIERNHKLGLLCEFAVRGTKGGKDAKMLLCASRIDEILDQPEGVAFFDALLSYMGSSDFQPQYTLTHADLMKQLYAPVAERTIQGVKNISDYAKPKN